MWLVVYTLVMVYVCPNSVPRISLCQWHSCPLSLGVSSTLLSIGDSCSHSSGRDSSPEHCNLISNFLPDIFTWLSCHPLRCNLLTHRSSSSPWKNTSCSVDGKFNLLVPQVINLGAVFRTEFPTSKIFLSVSHIYVTPFISTFKALTPYAQKTQLWINFCIFMCTSRSSTLNPQYMLPNRSFVHFHSTTTVEHLVCWGRCARCCEGHRAWIGYTSCAQHTCSLVCDLQLDQNKDVQYHSTDLQKGCGSSKKEGITILTKINENTGLKFDKMGCHRREVVGLLKRFQGKTRKAEVEPINWEVGPRSPWCWRAGSEEGGRGGVVESE